MKLKIKALTNQNVCIDTYTYPPFSDIECELDTKDIPIYSKAFEQWEIIDPVVQVIENIKTIENPKKELSVNKNIDKVKSKPKSNISTKNK